VISIEDQFDDVLLGHLGQLSGEDVLEIQQELDVLVVLVVADHPKSYLVGLLLLLGRTVASHKSQSHILPLERSVPIRACPQSCWAFTSPPPSCGALLSKIIK
jgi:hypothetical protein